MTDLSIIIVSWNVAGLLNGCLESIRQHKADLQLEVIVVDSASDDNTVEIIRQQHPWVTLLPQSENVGFTRGNNIGLQHAGGRYLLLLNPDTRVHAGMLTGMVAYMDEHPIVGIIGPHTYNPDGTTQPSRRRFPTLATALFESTRLQAYAPRHVLQRYYLSNTPDNATLDVDWVQGHALLARHELYDQVGGLDPAFVMYFEELDWCKRAKAAGWRVVYLGNLHVTHYGGSSSEQAGAYSTIQFNRSKVRYFGKHHGPFVAHGLRAFLLLMFIIQSLEEGTKYLLRHKPTLRKQRLHLYWQVLRSGL